MLHKETVSAGTLELLKDLMNDKMLTGFFLVGGTALALQIGHRISVDIDMFSLDAFDENVIIENLESQKEFKLNFRAKNTIKGEIQGIQIDFITHTYKLVRNTIIDEGIRMASLEDIAAMKLNAIIGNGTRLKYFIDIAFLSCHLSLAQMIAAYEKKYLSRNPLMILKSLSYHNDINFDEPIHLVQGNYSSQKIQGRLIEIMQSQDKVFTNFL